MWIGSSLSECSPTHRGAVTVTGIAFRVEHDTGVEYSAAEIRNALAAEGIRVLEGDRLAKIYASSWSARARACFTVLRASMKNGGV